MKNLELINLIVSKTLIFEEYTIKFLEEKVKKLPPSGKYIAFLLAYTILINRLKTFGIIQSGKINTADLTEKILEEAILRFNKYKLLSAKGGPIKNLYTVIVQNNIKFFRNSEDNLKLKTIAILPILGFDLENQYELNETYINLYIHPFFKTDVYLKVEQVQKREKYISSEIHYSYYDEENFSKKIYQLIDELTDIMNNDSYFISQFLNRNLTSNDVNKNCYVATLAYQDINHPKVEFLRQFRDAILSRYLFGKIFIKYYYLISPKIVKKLKNHTLFNRFIKINLDILIYLLKK